MKDEAVAATVHPGDTATLFLGFFDSVAYGGDVGIVLDQGVLEFVNSNLEFVGQVLDRLQPTGVAADGPDLGDAPGDQPHRVVYLVNGHARETLPSAGVAGLDLGDVRNLVLLAVVEATDAGSDSGEVGCGDDLVEIAVKVSADPGCCLVAHPDTAPVVPRPACKLPASLAEVLVGCVAP